MQLHGGTAFFRLSLAPRISGGAVIGTYGLLFDMDTPELTLPDRHAGRPDDPALLHNTMLDAETGLWSHRTFGEEIARRFDRLDVEEQPGTLLYLGFSRSGTKFRSAVAIRLAEELRDIVRPTDLLGRIDESTIGLWCDGMDHLTGGERAAKFLHQPARHAARARHHHRRRCPALVRQRRRRHLRTGTRRRGFTPGRYGGRTRQRQQRQPSRGVAGVAAGLGV